MGAPHDPEDLAGSALAGQRWGHYRIERPLGTGGMGTVFAAWDELLDRPVALKLLHARDEDALLSEARAIAALSHPNVVRIHGLERSDERAFVVMEHIEGRSCDELLSEQRFTLPSAVEAIRGAAAALHAIHQAGRLHGDVKPSNILIERASGRVLLTDFGLSRRIEDVEPATIVRGTPEYLAPERARGAYTPPELRPRQDVYSLAATAYDLLTGRPPFDEENVREVLRKQAFEEPRPPSVLRPQLTWRVDRAILAGLRKKPAERTATTLRFAEDLAEAAARGGAPPRILVVDDDGAHRQVVAHALVKRLGRTVIESAGDGERALEAAMARAPDLAILDLEMPGMNGIELAMAMRSTPKLERVPLIVVSGRMGPAERDVLARLGVERCFDKPVLLWKLARAASELLGAETVRASGRYPRADVHRNARTPDPEDAE